MSIKNIKCKEQVIMKCSSYVTEKSIANIDLQLFCPRFSYIIMTVYNTKYFSCEINIDLNVFTESNETEQLSNEACLREI